MLRAGIYFVHIYNYLQELWFVPLLHLGRRVSRLSPKESSGKYVEILVCMQSLVFWKHNLYITILGSRVLLAGRLLWICGCDGKGLQNQERSNWEALGLRFVILKICIYIYIIYIYMYTCMSVHICITNLIRNINPLAFTNIPLCNLILNVQVCHKSYFVTS